MMEGSLSPAAAGAGILAVNGLIRQIRGLADRIQDVSAALLRPEGITPAQRALLAALRTGGPATAAQAARMLGVSRQHARQLAAGLVRAGWLEYRDNPEHRTAPLATLTPSGQAGLRRILAREGEAVADLAACLTPRQVRETAQALAALQEALAGVERPVGGAQP